MSTFLIKHVVNGDSFFFGIALLLGACVLRWTCWKNSNRFSVLLFLIGILFVFLSATPLPNPTWAGLISISLVWLFQPSRGIERRQPPRQSSSDFAESPKAGPAWKRRGSLFLDALFLGSWLLAAASEIPRQFSPRLMGQTPSQLIVIADSITAGIDEGEAVTWPNRLRKQHSVEILDLSRMGATLSSALKRIDPMELPPGIILIELGGNDILGTTSTADFERGLNDLLKRVASPEHQVLMFELPLPPAFNRFGQIQRRLARQFRVTLIPKRVLADVLFSRNATLDSIHLTQLGHDKLAKVAWAIVSNGSGE